MYFWISLTLWEEAISSDLTGVSIPKKQGSVIGGELILTCTSFAPAFRNILLIFLLVVARTMESSTVTIFLLFNSSLTGLSLILTPKWRIVCSGSMKVRPT